VKRVVQDKLEKLAISEDTSIIEAIRTINSGYEKIAFVVNPENRMLGTITDGDIRRGLIRGLSLDDSASLVMNPNFRWSDHSVSRSVVMERLIKQRIENLPILDDERRLVGLYNLHDMLRGRQRLNWAVISAGGKGTRLGEFTKNLPKPMLPIGDRPILEHIVVHLVSHGIRRIFISVHHLGKMIEDHFGDGSKWGCQIEYLREQQPLHTGGALSLLPDIPAEPLLLMNGDLLTRLNVERFLDFHEAGSFAATLAVRNAEFRIPFGVVESELGKVISIMEKPAHTYQVNGGIYSISPEILSMVPENTSFPITSLLEQLLELGKPVGAYDMQEQWVDIGLLDSYLAHHQPKDG